MKNVSLGLVPWGTTLDMPLVSLRHCGLFYRASPYKEQA